MTVQTRPSAPSTSRRSMLAGALGGIAALAASAIGRPAPLRAGVDGDVVLGAVNTATTGTVINMTGGDFGFATFALSGPAIIAQGGGSATGVDGESRSGYGVRGLSGSFGSGGAGREGAGVLGASIAENQPATVGWSQGHFTGLLGYSNGAPTGLPAAKAKTGVYGSADQDSTSRGVWGESPAGHGVHGAATSGVAVYGTAATTGYALQTDGRTKFSTSGVATIAAGSKSVTVTPGVDVTADSFVLLSPKVSLASRALWFTTDATSDTFTIHMSGKSSAATAVAWLLLG